MWAYDGAAIGERIRAERQAQGLSQRVLARQARISPSYLCRLEYGLYPRPSMKNVTAIAEALGVPLNQLLRTPDEVDALLASLPVEERDRLAKFSERIMLLTEADRATAWLCIDRLLRTLMFEQGKRETEHPVILGD